MKWYEFEYNKSCYHWNMQQRLRNEIELDKIDEVKENYLILQYIYEEENTTNESEA